MIIVDNVHKRYQTEHGPGKWVLQGVSFIIPPNVNVGLVGCNGAGKSTLLRIIGGVDQPTRGRVERRCNVSWPMGFGGGLQGSLTGRQNAKFICRIHGHEDDIPERLAAIQEFAEIGEAFDEPVKTYSSGMAARLKFAISLAFDFDVYISDELTAVGDAAFKNKAKEAFQNLIGKAGLIMVSHSEGTLKEFCQSGIWLNDGQARWFDDINDAIRAYRETLPVDAAAKPTPTVPSPPEEDALATKFAQMEGLRRAMNVLQKGIGGDPVTLDFKAGGRVIRHAGKLGMKLLPKKKIAKQGYLVKAGAVPLLRRQSEETTDKIIDLYDLHTQCVKAKSTENDTASPQ